MSIIPEAEELEILKEEAINESISYTSKENFDNKKDMIDIYSKTFATIFINKIKNKFGDRIFSDMEVSEQKYHEKLYEEVYKDYNQVLKEEEDLSTDVGLLS